MKLSEPDVNCDYHKHDLMVKDIHRLGISRPLSALARVRRAQAISLKMTLSTFAENI